jgi:hypothetical protein
MHDEHQELCAAASIGQAGLEEIARLKAHLIKCGACRRAYSEFTNIAARQYAQSACKEGMPPDEERQLPDSEILRHRFLQRVAQEGILTSPNRLAPACREYHLSSFPWARRPLLQRTKRRPSFAAMVALIAIVAIASAYQIGRRTSPIGLFVGGSFQSPKLSENTITIAPGSTKESPALDAGLEAQVTILKKHLETNHELLLAVRDSLRSTANDKEKLVGERLKLETAVRELQRRLTESEELLLAAREEKSKLQDEATKLKSDTGRAQATYVADQIKIRELGEELAEKKSALELNGQFLQRDRDIRELMTARNLHIFDVFDSDAKGKTKPAFGRIFYTEGRSLIFYAYDLNEAKAQDANYHYRVWGGREGQKDKVMSLGVFYSDDKSQRRWVYKCDDPNILSEIDSVFVTLEPPGATSSHPIGQKLLDAYLHGMANHP